MGEVTRYEGPREPAKLETLAERINTEHRACEMAANAALGHALEAGRLLEEAKSEHEHGTWQAWLEANFDGSERTARLYRQLWRERAQLAEETKRQGVAALSIVQAMRYIARKPDPLLHWPPVPGTVPLTPEQEKAERAKEREVQRLLPRAEYSLRMGTPYPMPDVKASGEAWQQAIARALEIRREHKLNVVDAVAHGLNVLSSHVTPESVGREPAAPTGDQDKAENRATMLAELRDGMAWIERVLEEAEAVQGREQLSMPDTEDG